MAGLYNSYEDNILVGSTPSGTAPSSTYALTTLLTFRPEARVLWGATSATITFTLGSSKTGAILAIPMHNLTPGSSSVLTLTNGAGLSQAIAVPALQADGFPPTLLYDFSALSNRSASVWNLVISGNVANVALGGVVAIYSTKRDLASIAGGNVQWQHERHETPQNSETVNEYGTLYIQDYETKLRQIKVAVTGKESELQGVLDWFRASHGRGRPSMYWPVPGTVDGYFGRWQKTYIQTAITGIRRKVEFTFDEDSKGKPF